MRVLSREDEFHLLWQEMGGPPLEREYRFHPDRRWRSDFALPDVGLLIEIEGGVWQQGRHNRPQGYINDVDKYNEAARLGFVLVRFVPDMFEDKYIKPWVEWCKQRLE